MPIHDSRETDSPSASPVPAAQMAAWASMLFLTTWLAWLLPLGWWAGFQPNWLLSEAGGVIVVGSTVLLWVPVIAGFYAVGALVKASFPGPRRTSLRNAGWGFVLAVSSLVGNWWGYEVWKQEVQAFVTRSQPLVSALHQYARDQGASPPTLEALVPKYLPEVPQTGWGSRPNYLLIHATQDSSSQIGEQSDWALQATPPAGAMSFDKMLYLPSQKYDGKRLGGSIIRFGDWAYVKD